MTVSDGNTSYIKMPWRRGKSPGWAAYDLKQRKKQGLEPELDNEPFPPMSSTLASLRSCKNPLQPADTQLPERPFSSALIPSMTEKRECNKLLQVSDSGSKHGNKVLEGNNYVPIFKKLKEIHSWADDSLIEDIMAAVDNDVIKASVLLRTMVSAEEFELNKETNITGLDSTLGSTLFDKNTPEVDKDVSLGEFVNLAELGTALEDHLPSKNKVLTDEHASCDNMLLDNTAHLKFITGQLSSVPVEPEWEEDDLYLSHRKDAIRMMRSASQHSKAANNAFLRGDHFFAQKLSLKAREEWMAAERLNSKAAKEILSIRNIKNDLWKLDLHGLHAVEAVHALQEHLQRIETHLSLNRSVSPNRCKTNTRVVRSPSLESLNFMDKKELDKRHMLSRERPTSLEVITGIGNHSRGQAALPTTVRSFLIENGYRFDEARPGAISVRPKYHHR
ncbi:uncharacterized protein LOC131160387 [Malania oleifera]|uniref:uncharacterized protein LOC131160387 n=1 Tax=Malania oleifera TaxID=397392 RepID=UPI0025AEC6DD|nr:uncharacterized protein LOC131160387 [Malania oleifera]XP_057972015.1 uncharacterized protein LOC131160387 [Malania oleifera]XP_057972016.1 uncharacterized protein LOC131160387 [Malania oleifera]